jgi:hypothetical protein
MAYFNVLEPLSMDRLRSSHRLGRLLAAWLLLWCLAMTAVPIPPPVLVKSDRAMQVAGSGAEVSHCGEVQDEHHAHDAHEGHRPDASGQIPTDAHGDHGSGSVSHCPMCTHAAAPELAQPGQMPTVGCAGVRLLVEHSGTLRVRTDAPPPGRGPPALS